MREWFDLFNKYCRENIFQNYNIFWRYYWTPVLLMIFIDAFDFLIYRIMKFFWYKWCVINIMSNIFKK